MAEEKDAGKENADVVRFTLRMPNELHAALMRISKKENRSLHAEILTLLQKAVGDEQNPKFDRLPNLETKKAA